MESNLVLIEKLKTQLKSSLDKNKDYKDKLRQTKTELAEVLRENEELSGKHSSRSKRSGGSHQQPRVEIIEKLVRPDPSKLLNT